MKNLFLFLTLCLSLNLTQAQTHLNFRAGAFIWGSGDIIVPTLEFELSQTLHRSFEAGASMGFGHFSSLANENPIQGNANSITTFFLDLTLRWKVIKTKYFGISIASGPSFRYFNQAQYFSASGLNEFSYAQGEYRANRNQVVGVLIRPEFFVNISKKDQIFFSASTTPYTMGEISSGFSVSYRRKL